MKNYNEKIDNTLKDLAYDFVKNLVNDNLGIEIDTELDGMIEEIKDDEVKKALTRMYDAYKYPEPDTYFRFQSYVMEQLANDIENEKIKEYVKEEDINFYEWDNNLTLLKEYLYFFIKLDQAYNNIDQKGLLDEVIDEVLGYLPDLEDVKNHLENPYCAGGGVGKLIYYSDTVAFYEKYEDEINELISNLMRESGDCSMKEIFGDRWEEDDPLVKGQYNQNLLAWFGYEEVARKLYWELFED